MRRYTFLIVASVLLLSAILPMAYLSNYTVTAAPMLVVTPVAGIVSHGGTPKTVKTFMSSAITTTTNGAAQRVIDYDVVDLQLIVDQTAVNTVTLKLQHSITERVG